MADRQNVDSGYLLMTNEKLIDLIEYASCSYYSANEALAKIIFLINQCKSLFELEDALHLFCKKLPCGEFKDKVASALRARIKLMRELENPSFTLDKAKDRNSSEEDWSLQR